MAMALRREAEVQWPRIQAIELLKIDDFQSIRDIPGILTYFTYLLKGFNNNVTCLSDKFHIGIKTKQEDVL